MKNKVLCIGTRGSPLAMVQTEGVVNRISERYPQLSFRIVPIKTKGDILHEELLSTIGGKGVFVKEIEDALLKGTIDMAVHSLKDMPVDLPPGLCIGAITAREDPRDVWISRSNVKFERLRKGARIGTSSLRRKFQLLTIYPDLNIVPIRGNLDTRIKKIHTENLDGIIVAAAGLRRMAWTELATQFLPPETLLPAAGQGALAIEIREDAEHLREMLAFLHCGVTEREVQAERAFLKCIGGGCRLPVAVFAQTKGDTLMISALLGTPDGRMIIREELKGPVDDHINLGVQLAENVLSRGGKAILKLVCK
ncbi:MAG: hydroxymethylbilane synthase [Syntrophales bacterium]|nr:hydroxymethylbilane synthase [Syntrophales bacterium]